MKKALSILGLLTLVSILLMFVFAIYHYSIGDKVTSYHRFQKNDGIENKFNYWGLLSPIQPESQRIIRDTIHFSCKVIYPLAPKFNLVNPADTTAEAFVAIKISKVIKDTLDKIQINLKFDYDNQMLAVRNAAKPNTLKLKKPTIQLSLLGTASPEAIKYDFEKSLKPGNYEIENCNLAKDRLNRTTLLLKEYLCSMGIKTIEIENLDYEELQLTQKSEVQRILKDHSLLNGMRYVIASVKIPTEKLEVTPVTEPILLPFWLMGLYGIYLLLFRKRNKKPVQPKSNIRFPWLEMLIILTSILSMFALVYYLFTLLPPFPMPEWLIPLIIKILILILILILIYLILKTIKETVFFFSEMWKALKDLFENILYYILMSIFWILIGIMWIFYWWGERTTCQKILLIHFLIDLVILITWLMGLWHICF